MLRRSLVLLAVLSLARVTQAESTRLPYRVQTSDGNQWMVYNQGSLQQQGNQPVFSQAAQMVFNGNQLNINNNQATLDDKTKELTLKFPPQNGVNITRRILFDENSTIARVIDVFDNTGAKETTVNFQLQTYTNFGINGGDIVKDPKKGSQIGWSVDTGGGRAATSLFAGKGSKINPKITWQNGNNVVQANYSIKVPGKGTAAVVSWHGTFDSADDGVKWITDLKEGKALKDVPGDLRKNIVNVGTTGGFVGDRELLRGDQSDIAELRGGDQLRGTIKLDKIELTAAFGDVTLAADKVAGIINVGDYRPRQLLITTDGEIFGGTLKAQSIPIELSSGQTTSVPLSQVSRIGYRKHDGEPEEWSFKKPMLLLRGGERFVIQPPTEAFDFLTRYGMVHLKPEQVSTLILQSEDNGISEIYLADGSRLSGLLVQTQWAFKLVSNTSDSLTNFQSVSMQRVQLSVPEENAGAGQPTLDMSNGDILAARLAGEMKIDTAFDTINLNAGQIASVLRNEESGALSVTLFDQSNFRGAVQGLSLKVTTTGGVALEIPVASIRAYVNPSPLPSEAMVTRMNDQIKQLDAEDWKQRDAAEAALVGMGSSITPALKEAVAGKSPEVTQRLQSVIAKLEKNAPKAASRLPVPPTIE